MALSGGVDSTVAAVLVHKAIGKISPAFLSTTVFFGKMNSRKCWTPTSTWGLNIKGVDAKDKFYTALNGLTDPEAKRKAIGKTFIDVFDEESHLIKDVAWLGQGNNLSGCN